MPSYYAIIPANVRYDKRLNLGARLLYGEITALCNEKGFCWASNSYFAELYDVSIRTISSWINKLVEFNYLHSEIRYKEGSKEVDTRKISIPPMEENFQTPRRKTADPLEENFQENTTSINTTINKEPVDLLYKSESFKEAWEEWVKYRKQRKIPKYTEVGLRRTFKDLAELSGNDEATAIEIIHQAIAKSWQGLYGIKKQPISNTVSVNKYENARQAQLASFKPVSE